MFKKMWNWLKSGSGIYAWITGTSNFSSDESVVVVPEANQITVGGRPSYFYPLNITRVVIVAVIVVISWLFILPYIKKLFSKR
jgi:hypothetical protein